MALAAWGLTGAHVGSFLARSRRVVRILDLPPRHEAAALTRMLLRFATSA